MKFLRKRKKLSIGILTAGLVIIIFAVVGLAQKPPEAEKKNNQVKHVEILEIKKQDQIESKLVVKGTILPKSYTRIRSLVQGTVQFLQPVSGRVAKAENLFALTDSGIENNFFNAQDSFSQARRNLAETEGLTVETLGQAELSVASAEASLNLAEENLLVARDNAEQSLQLAEEEARVAYSTAYNTMDQVMRFYGKGSIVDYILENTPTASVQALDDAEIQFDKARVVFLATPSSPPLSFRPTGGSGEISSSGNIDGVGYLDEVYPDKVGARDDNDNEIIFYLGELQDVLAEVKKLADNTFLALNFSLADDSTSFRRALIDGYKTQTITFISQLNAQASALNRAQNGVESAVILNRGDLVAAENQVKLAQIQYDNSLSSLESARRSVDLQKLGSQQQLTASQAQLNGASYQYNNLFLNSPFSGVVIAHRVDVGDQVSPGEVILEMGDINGVEIEVSVDSTSAELLKIGQTVVISTSSRAKRSGVERSPTHVGPASAGDSSLTLGMTIGLTGTISEISPTADLTTGKVSVKIEADNTEELFNPGDVAEITLSLIYDKPGSVVVPLSSVTVGQSETFVLVAENTSPKPPPSQGGELEHPSLTKGRNEEGFFYAVKRKVTLGEVFDINVEVVSGLEEGDLVILQNGVLLQAGDEIEITNDKQQTTDN